MCPSPAKFNDLYWEWSDWLHKKELHFHLSWEPYRVRNHPDALTMRCEVCDKFIWRTARETPLEDIHDHCCEFVKNHRH
jgi:hypothetical protein